MHQQGHKPHLGGTWAGGDPNSWAPEVWTQIVLDKGIKTVIDVGCGDGYSTQWFQQRFITALGIEGDKGSIERCRSRNLFVLEHDYTEGPLVNNTMKALMVGAPHVAHNIFKQKLKDFHNSALWDLVWCCEFVEHVEEQYMQNFFSTFQLGKYLAMTHAFPGQPGHHHVNCQWPEYWIPKIEALGFSLNRPYTFHLRSLTKAQHVNRSLLFFEKEI